MASPVDTTTISTPANLTLPEQQQQQQQASEEETVSSPRAIITLDSNGEHMLQTPWTFWFSRKIPKTQHPTPINYAEHLQKIAAFNTVESFYRTYVYIARPQELPKESHFHMFKGDAVPMWESFPNGGCWIIKITKKNPQLALIWEELLVYAVGETFEEPDIVGVVLNIRAKEYVLQIWNSDSQNAILRARVCEKLRYYLRLEPTTPIEYKPNSLSLKGNDKVSNRNGKASGAAKDKKKKKKGNKANSSKAEATGNTNNTNINNNAQATSSTSSPSSPTTSNDSFEII